MSKSIYKILGVTEGQIFYDASEGAIKNVYYKIENGVLYSTVDVAFGSWIITSSSTLIDLIENGKIEIFYAAEEIIKLLYTVKMLNYKFVSRTFSYITLYRENEESNPCEITFYHNIWKTICPINYKIYEIDELITNFEQKCNIN